MAAQPRMDVLTDPNDDKKLQGHQPVNPVIKVMQYPMGDYMNDVLDEEDLVTATEAAEACADLDAYLRLSNPYHDAAWHEGRGSKKAALATPGHRMVIGEDRPSPFAANKASRSHHGRKYAAISDPEPLHCAAWKGIDRHYRAVVDANGTCLPFGHVRARIESRGRLSQAQLDAVIDRLRIVSALAFSDAICSKYTHLGDSSGYDDPDDLEYLQSQMAPRYDPDGQDATEGPKYGPEPQWHSKSWMKHADDRPGPEHFATCAASRLSPMTTLHAAEHEGRCVTEVALRHVLTHSAIETALGHMRLFATDMGLCEERSQVFSLPRQEGSHKPDACHDDERQVTVTWAFDEAAYDPEFDHLCLAQTPGNNHKAGEGFRWSPMRPLTFVHSPGAHDFADRTATREVCMETVMRDHPLRLLQSDPDASITKRGEALAHLKMNPVIGPAPLVPLHDYHALLEALPEREDYPLPVIHALLVHAKNRHVPAEVIQRLYARVKLSLPPGDLRTSQAAFVRAYRGIRTMPEGQGSIEEAFAEKLLLACFPHTETYRRTPAYRGLHAQRVREWVRQATQVTMSAEEMRSDYNITRADAVHLRHLAPLAETMLRDGIQVLYVQSPLGSGKSTILRTDLPVLVEAARTRANAARASQGLAPLEEVIVLAVSCRRAFCYALHQVLEDGLGRGTVEMYDKRLDEDLKRVSAKSATGAGVSDGRARKHKVFQFESLHKLLDFLQAQPGLVAIVVMDESESSLAQAKSPTNGDGLEMNLVALRLALQQAQFVICMDGLMTDRSLACIQGMCGYKPALYVHNSHKGNNEPVLGPDGQEVLVAPQQIVEIFGSKGQRGKPGLDERMRRFAVKLAPQMAARGEKLFFGSGHQKTIQCIDEALAEGGLLPEGKEVVRIDSTKRHPPELMVDMTSWFGRDEVAVVMASPSMTVGNNADVTFDRRLMLVSANSADPFAMVQMSGRIRHFRNRTTYLALNDRFERDGARSGDVFPVFDRKQLARIATDAGMHDPDFNRVWVYNTQVTNVCRYFTRAVVSALYELLGYAVHLARDPYVPYGADADGDDQQVPAEVSVDPIEEPAPAPSVAEVAKRKRGRPKKSPDVALVVPKVAPADDVSVEPTDDAWTHTEPEIKALVQEVERDIREAAEAQRRDEEDSLAAEEETKKRSNAPEWDSVPVVTSEAEWNEWNRKMKEGDPDARTVITKWRYLKMFGGRERYAPDPETEADLLAELVQYWDTLYPRLDTIWHNVFYCNLRMTCGKKADQIAYFKCNDVSRNFMDRLRTKYDIVSTLIEGLLEEGDTGGLFVPGKVISHERVKKVGGILLRNLRYVQNLFDLKPRTWNTKYTSAEQNNAAGTSANDTIVYREMQHHCAVISDIIGSWTGSLMGMKKGQQRQKMDIDEHGHKIRIDVSDYVISVGNAVSDRMLNNMRDIITIADTVSPDADTSDTLV